MQAPLKRHQVTFLIWGDPSDHQVFCFPRMAENVIATSAIIPPMKKLKFMALTKTAGFAGVGVAVASPL